MLTTFIIMFMVGVNLVNFVNMVLDFRPRNRIIDFGKSLKYTGITVPTPLIACAGIDAKGEVCG